MNPRKLAEEANRLMALSSDELLKAGPRILFMNVADALIAQADLLEKYRRTRRGDHQACEVMFDQISQRRDLDVRCDLCRAYDKLMEGE